MTKTIYLGLDGEMTGSGSRERKIVASKKYQLIQIGVALSPVDYFVSDIGYKTWKYQPEAMKVNGFTKERVEAGPSPDYVDKALVQWLEKNVGKGKRDLHAVGWNVGSFDMPFVAEYLPDVFNRFSYRSVDLNSIVFAMTETDDEYKKLKGWAKSKAEVAMREQFKQPAWHNAGYDAIASLLAFQYLSKYIREECSLNVK